MPQNKINVFRTKDQLHILKPLLIFLFIFGFNYFNFKTRLYKILSYLYISALYITLIITASYTYKLRAESTMWIALEYLASSVAVLLTHKCTISFFHELKKIDPKLRLPRKYYKCTSYGLIGGIVLVGILRVIYIAIYCYVYDCVKYIQLYLVFFFALTALDLHRFWRLALCCIVKMRLKIIRLKLEDDPNNNIYLYVDKNKTLLGNKLKVLLELYKQFAEAVELVNREIHASVFICVVCSLPKLISYVYSIFLVFEGHAVYITFEFISVHVLQVCLYLFLPFVVSEGYSIEIEKIQLILMNKLIKETDKSTKEDIDLFLRYIDVKNFKYKVWRIMPLSITFPLELINICTTYVIVLINFTHLYD